MYPAVLPEGYLSAANHSDAWWANPHRSGHGPFDVITPPVADALLRANASAAICPTLSKLLEAAYADLPR